VSEWVGWVLFAVVIGGPVVFLAIRVSRRLGARQGPAGAALPWLCLAGFFVLMLAHLAGEHWGRGAHLTIMLALLAGLIAIPAWLQRRERPRPTVELTPDYSHEDGPKWLTLAAVLVPLIVLIGGSQVSRGSSLAAVIVLGSVVISVVVLTALLLLWRRRRQRAIIEAVERQADSLDPAELESLVERLETEHGKLEMRRLRRLVKERPRA
jgi:hypothetical protein